MKITHATTYLSGICLSFALAACGSDSSTCDENGVAKEYLVNNYQVKMVQYAEPIDNQSAYKLPSAINSGAEVSWNTFSIEVKADFQTYSVDTNFFPAISLFNHALACSPNPGTAKQQLSKISITSSHDYNGKYPAGSELASVFATIDFPFTPVADFTKYAAPAPKAIKIYLLEAPALAQQNFTIAITLDDGRHFSISTGDVRLK